MKTYFLLFKVRPLPGCEQLGVAKGAFAAFWIVTSSPCEAQRQAEEHLRQHHWRIEERAQRAVATTHEQQIHGEIGETHYHQAQRDGLSVQWLGWVEDSI